MSSKKLKPNRKGRKTMKNEMINHEAEIAIEIEELESIVAPSSSSSFLD
jgi:hypothetical protein